jgi:transcriptional regulator with XRE-family HTH domain
MKSEVERNFYRTLGSRIRQLRRMNLSQEQLAKASQLSRTSIVNIEAGRQKLLVYNLFQIAAALKSTPGALLAPLEPTKTEIPKIDSSSDAAEWVQRSVKRAIETKLSQ